MKRFLFIAGVTLILVCTFMALKAKHYKEKAERLSINQSVLMDSVKTYKTKADKNAAEVGVLTLTVEELESSRAYLSMKVHDMGVKLKRTQSLASTTSETKLCIQTIVRDSIVYRDTAYYHVRAFNWRDPWTDIRGTIDNDTATLKINNTDTLAQVVHRIPKRFLFFKFGTKKLVQAISSSNPHTKIVHSEFITILK